MIFANIARGGGFRRAFNFLCRGTVLSLFLTLLAFRASAALQFDVFLGFDGTTREGNWFPVACEVFNDGPTFNAVVEVVNDGDTRRSQVRQMAVELPTNTRKRFVIPVFSSGRHSAWTARLIDDRGKVRAEQVAMSVRNDVNHDTFAMGALPRVFGGLPMLPAVRGGRTDAQPVVARMDAAHFPDNPIAFEALNAIYINSEKALELKDGQRRALIAWLNGGGHLIIGVEQPADVNGTPWLRNLLPCDVTGVSTVKVNGEFQNWVQNWSAGTGSSAGFDTMPRRNKSGRNSSRSETQALDVKSDSDFEGAELPVVDAVVREGQTLVSIQGKPVIIQADRGRGKVTVLAFSPEREPFRAWKNRAWFWARAGEIPVSVFTVFDSSYTGRWGIDGVFGAMLDSKQVRKLPVGWLLALLVVYLLVVGPLDQYWLKKINKQMLTWITFPIYVVLFSVLIYWIGFMLRAGEIEWNELHVVDVMPLPGGDQAHLRGQMYASIYSPANATYGITSDKSVQFATLRGEFSGAMGGGQDTSRANVQQRGDGFSAEMFVPVWVSQLYVGDWLQTAAAPLGFGVTQQGGNYTVTVTNRTSRALKNVTFIVNKRVHELGELPGGATKQATLAAGAGAEFGSYLGRFTSGFSGVVQQRRQAFGNEMAGRLEITPENVLAASFCGQISGMDDYYGGGGGYQSQFVAPKRFDLSPAVERGDAILVAWDANGAPISAFNKFSPKRGNRSSFYRLTAKVEKR